ncbi:hypothetical protein PFISCL1PPCAC_17062, partial [Pristionchus fissidentatus]
DSKPTSRDRRTSSSTRSSEPEESLVMMQCLIYRNLSPPPLRPLPPLRRPLPPPFPPPLRPLPPLSCQPPPSPPSRSPHLQPPLISSTDQVFRAKIDNSGLEK